MSVLKAVRRVLEWRSSLVLFLVVAERWLVTRSKPGEWRRVDAEGSLVVALVVVGTLCVPKQMSLALGQRWISASRLLKSQRCSL